MQFKCEISEINLRKIIKISVLNVGNMIQITAINVQMNADNKTRASDEIFSIRNFVPKQLPVNLRKACNKYPAYNHQRTPSAFVRIYDNNGDKIFIDNA